MNTGEFKSRTKQFALRIIKLSRSLVGSGDPIAWVLGKQILRSGTSVGANYRAACRARSPADFIAKLGIVEEECDETSFWLELLEESGIVSASRLSKLKSEADELLAMTVASINTARKHRPKPARSRS
jgi:four helix bundle protein